MCTAKPALDCCILREDCLHVSDLYFSSLPFPLHRLHSISLHPFTAHTFWFCSSLSPPPGKILFRRSHVRDVAMKRLRFIDDYCRVKRPFCQHPSVPHLTVGKVPPPRLLGVKGHSPYCPFTCSKHEFTELLWRGGAVYLSYSETRIVSIMCTDTEVLWVSEGLSLVLWSFAATVERLFISLCATVTDAGRPSCASNCMKQTLSSFMISKSLSLTSVSLYLIHFSQISVLKKKRNLERLSSFSNSREAGLITSCSLSY